MHMLCCISLWKIPGKKEEERLRSTRGALVRYVGFFFATRSRRRTGARVYRQDNAFIGCVDEIDSIIIFFSFFFSVTSTILARARALVYQALSK